MQEREQLLQRAVTENRQLREASESSKVSAVPIGTLNLHFVSVLTAKFRIIPKERQWAVGLRKVPLACGWRLERAATVPACAIGRGSNWSDTRSPKPTSENPNESEPFCSMKASFLIGYVIVTRCNRMAELEAPLPLAEQSPGCSY